MNNEKKRLKFDCFYSDTARIRTTIILPSGTFPKAILRMKKNETRGGTFLY